MSYSLRDRVFDGAISKDGSPRWLLHLIKIAQHSTPAYYLGNLTHRPILSAVLCGPLAYLGILYHKHIWRREPFFSDWIHDGALATVCVGGAMIGNGYPLEGWLVVLLCAEAWLRLHERALP